MASNNRTLLERIVQNTAPQRQKEAQGFKEAAEENGLSPATLNALFSLASDARNPSYDIGILRNLELDRIDYGIPGTSATGQYLKHIKIILKNAKGQKEEFGWPTMEKFLEASAKAGIQTMPALLERAKRTEKDFTRLDEQADKEYASTLQEGLAGKRVQSLTERREVKSLLGLDDAIKEATRGVYESFSQLLDKPDFWKEGIQDYLELFSPRGGFLRKLKEMDNHPEDIAKALTLVTAGRKLLEPEEYLQLRKELRTYYDTVVPIHAKSHLKSHLDDLAELAAEKELTGNPYHLLKAARLLQEETTVCTPIEAAAILRLYDVKNERVRRGKAHRGQSVAYEQAVEDGEEFAKTLFINDGAWKGGKDESVPKAIAQSPEVVLITAPRADPHLRNAQRWARSLYATENLDGILISKSFKEARAEQDSLVVLARKRAAAEKTGRILSDEYLPNEQVLNEHGISVEDLHERVMAVEEDSHSQQSRLTQGLFEYHAGERFPTKTVRKLAFGKEHGIIEPKAMEKLAEQAYRGKSVLEGLVDLVPFDKQMHEDNRTVNALVNHPALLCQMGLPSSYDKEPRYLSPDDAQNLKGYDGLLRIVGNQGEWSIQERAAIDKYRAFSHQDRWGKPAHRVLSADAGSTAVLDTYRPSESYETVWKDGGEHERIVYLDPHQKEALIEEMADLLPLTTDVRERGERLFSYQNRTALRKAFAGVEDQEWNKSWGAFKNAKPGQDYITRELHAKIVEMGKKV
jgi:hypothetical protein